MVLSTGRAGEEAILELRLSDKKLAKQRSLGRQTEESAGAQALGENKFRMLENRKLPMKRKLTR